LRPLILKELRGVLSGRALWAMLLVLCPLVGYSFFQAVALYGEASSAARDSPALASGLSPLDGVLVPTLGASYLATTLLFPFVAIRALGREKETGTLRLLVQLPYRIPVLVVAKMIAVMAAFLISFIPAMCALAVWRAFGGHVHIPETGNLLVGHLLYASLVGALALTAASIAESSATAAIIALALTIGSWVLDFALAGQPGILEILSRLSLTQTLRPFEQGLFSVGLALRILIVIFGLLVATGIWLHPGISLRSKCIRLFASILAVAVLLLLTTGFRASFDLTEDQRNSFSIADQRALSNLHERLDITVHFIPEDPRYTDLRRNVLDKLERTLPNVAVQLASTGRTLLGGASDESYGEVEYSYGGHSARSRSTSPREVLPLIYELAALEPPEPAAGGDYPGYPLIANAYAALPVFLGIVPILVLAFWFWINRAPRIWLNAVEQGGAS
jgi:ABC-type transport system involved in multi-copper enzyme maturation permease subunit